MEFSITLFHLIQLVIIASGLGALFAQVRQNKSDIQLQSQRMERIEERFLEAVEDMSARFAEVAEQIKLTLNHQHVELLLQKRDIIDLQRATNTDRRATDDKG
jgi:hypothetical protein